MRRTREGEYYNAKKRVRRKEGGRQIGRESVCVYICKTEKERSNKGTISLAATFV